MSGDAGEVLKDDNCNISLTTNLFFQGVLVAALVIPFFLSYYQLIQRI